MRAGRLGGLRRARLGVATSRLGGRSALSAARHAATRDLRRRGAAARLRRRRRGLRAGTACRRARNVEAVADPDLGVRLDVVGLGDRASELDAVAMRDRHQGLAGRDDVDVLGAGARRGDRRRGDAARGAARRRAGRHVARDHQTLAGLQIAGACAMLLASHDRARRHAVLRAIAVDASRPGRR